MLVKGKQDSNPIDTALDAGTTLIFKIAVSDYTRKEVDRCFGQSVTHGEIRVENEEAWNKHKASILDATQYYCNFREWDNDYSNDIKESGVIIFKGGNHFAFHDIVSGNRFALFTLTNGRVDTL